VKFSSTPVLIGLVLFVVSIPAWSQTATPPSAASVPSAVAHPLPISAGDLINVTVFDTPELSGPLRVNEKGFISVPIAGSLSVEGMTADQAGFAIEQLFRQKDILKTPAVSVFIAEYATQGVNVMGEVKSPGIYPLLGGHGLWDLVSAAGGVTPLAGRAVTITHKGDPTHPIVVQLETDPGSVAHSDIDIRPGDTVVVSRSGVVYVVGDVNHPGGFTLDSKMQAGVIEALAMAQGPARAADLDKAKLIRKNATGREEYSVELSKILKNQAPDIPLEDGDILYIPVSGVKMFRGRSMDAALSLTNGLAIAGRL